MTTMMDVMPEVKSTLTRIKASRLAFGFGDVKKASFDLGADIKEIGSVNGNLQVEYLLYLESVPSVLRAEMQGTATLPLRGFNTQEDLDSLVEAQVSEIAIQIFRNNYEALYLLFDSLGLPAPSPWMVKDVHLVRSPFEARLPAQEQVIVEV